MATSVISSIVKDPTGTRLASVPVICRLKPSNGFRGDGSEVTSRVTTTTDVNGAYSFTLERNAAITPANTWYEVEEQIPDANGGPAVWTISVGASNQNLKDARITPTIDAGYGTYLTEARANLLYALLGTTITTGTSNIFTGHQYFKSGRPRVDVMAFGATGDGSTDDLANIQLAADFAAAFGTGAVLYFDTPGSFYKVTGAIVIGNHTTVEGTGPNCLVKRTNGGTTFDAQLTDGVTFRSLEIDCNALTNFATCIDADQATNFTVEGCHLLNSGSHSGAWTIHGVLVRSGTNVRIRDNFFDGTQCKAGGANGTFGAATRCWVTDNLSIDAFNFAFSAVGDVGAGTGFDISDVTIARNICINAESGGIFVGQDGATGVVDGSYKRLAVHDNIIIGNSAQTVGYIQADVCDVSEAWSFKDNIIDGVTETTSRPGIRLQENDSVSSLNGLSIVGNHIINIGYHAIEVDDAARIAPFVIADNTAYESGGYYGDIRVGTTGTTTIYGAISGNTVQRIEVEGHIDVVIAANHVYGARPDFEKGGITLKATAGQTLGPLVVANSVTNSDEDGLSFSGTGAFSGAVIANRFQQITKTGIRGLPSTVKCGYNAGFVTENSGTGAIANGATAATITHGLGYTPSAYDISITPTNNPTNDPGTLYVNTIGASSFAVNCRADPGASTATFSWAVRKV